MTGPLLSLFARGTIVAPCRVLSMGLWNRGHDGFRRAFPQRPPEKEILSTNLVNSAAAVSNLDPEAPEKRTMSAAMPRFLVLS